MCHAQIAERYFRTVVTATGSDGMLRATGMSGSNSGSVAAHNANE